MPNTFSIVENMCREDNRMRVPKKPTYAVSTELLRRSMNQYNNEIADYNRYVASLRSYPILPGSKWHKTTGLVEEVDFEIAAQKPLKHGFNELFAVPLPPAERQEDMWIDVAQKIVAGYQLYKAPIQVAEILQQQYHITRKS